MQIVKLKVLADYRNRDVAYVKGATIEVVEPEAEFLQRDAPGCFEVVVAGPRVDEVPEEPKTNPETDAVDEAPVDKMVKRDDAKRK